MGTDINSIVQVRKPSENKAMNWPLVDPKDDGIRPAGRPDECFYCRQKVGEPHGQKCVIVNKLVEMRVTATFEDGSHSVGVWTLEEPYDWDKEMSEFHKNESSWCSGNLLNQRDSDSVVWEGDPPWEKLEALHEKGLCLCSILSFEFIRIADATPRRKLAE